MSPRPSLARRFARIWRSAYAGRWNGWSRNRIGAPRQLGRIANVRDSSARRLLLDLRCRMMRRILRVAGHA
jgi:hypothetical protein